MSLRDRLNNNTFGASSAAANNQASNGTPQATQLANSFADLKSRLHRELINRMDLTKINLLTPDQVHQEVSRLAKDLIDNKDIPLSGTEREKLIEEVRYELFGLGPLELLLGDPTISDILVNSPYKIYIERGGKLERTGVTFNDNSHVMRVIERIVSSVGRRIDESSPMVDARLQDGSRVNAVIPPIALDGPCLSIRRFGKNPLKMEMLVQKGALTFEMAEILKMCVKAKMNIIISGGTGAGKTTLLNALSSFIPEDERVVTIEDSAELMLQQPHVVRLETRPKNIEGKGEITARDCVKNALRMRPDRVVIGETRGEEAMDMLQAMNTGHDGSLTTIHANNPRDAMLRIETMIQMAGMKLTERAMRQQIASAVELVVQATRLSDGSRRVTYISEIIGLDDKEVIVQDVFKYERYGVDANGKVIGKHMSSGKTPQFLEKLRIAGCKVDEAWFKRVEDKDKKNEKSDKKEDKTKTGRLP
jgi:pilus assembly protein CpaF